MIHTPWMTKEEKKKHQEEEALKAKERRRQRRILYRLRNWWQNWRTRKVRAEAREKQRAKWGKLISDKIAPTSPQIEKPTKTDP